MTVNGYEIVDGADLRGADFREADLVGAHLRGANLYEADLRGADLRGSDLRDADLGETDLRGANLAYALINAADLEHSKGIRIFSVGQFNRLCFVYIHNDIIRFQLGLFNGTKEEAINEIRKKYGDDSPYEKIVSIYAEEIVYDYEKEDR